MQFKKAIVWWLANKAEDHPALAQDDKKIEGLIPLVRAMFPGINYYSVTGFGAVMRQCVIPALEKQHPELIGIAANDISADEMVEVAEVLPSDGGEWQDSQEWQSKFDDLLKAA